MLFSHVTHPRRLAGPFAALGLLAVLVLSQLPRPAPAQAHGSTPTGDVALSEEEQARMARRAAPDEAAEADLEAEAFDPSQYQIRELFEAGLREIVGRAPTSEEEEDGKLLRIQSEGYLDFDEESGTAYGRERTTIHYGDVLLTADRALLDFRLQEAEAYGNVRLWIGDDLVKAEKMRFNFKRQQGVGHQVRGTLAPYYFMADKNEDPAYPSFEKIDAGMSIFHKTSLTGCDFTIPHYRLRAKEFILLEGERIFARNAMLFVREVPIFVMPAYTRSLSEASPWSFQVGYDSDLGAAIRTTYDYYYKDYWPDPKGEDRRGKRRSYNQTTLIYDYLSKRGHGVGLRDRYDFNFNKHQGEIEIYSIKDNERAIAAPDAKDEEGDRRYRVAWGHRSAILRDLSLQVQADWLSDPDLHYDILDYFDDLNEQGRRAERRARVALSLVKERALARVLVEIKDRVGRDRATNFSEPGDDDSDFDRDLDSFGRGPEDEDEDMIEVDSEEGLSKERWARVSERYPQITIATRWLRAPRWPLYYQLDLNLLHNLDKGLNVLNEDDDSFVQGFDLYQALMLATEVGDHSSFVSKLGVGFGHIERQDDKFDLDFSEAMEGPDGTTRLDNLSFTDPDGGTFLVGTEEFNLSDYSPSFAYADFESQWTTRFTDALTGYLRYFIRQGTEDSLGEWYRSIGAHLARSDLYAFRLEEHEITGGLVYVLAQPDLSVSFSAGRNLRSRGERYPGENIHYANVDLDYTSPEETFLAAIGLGYRAEQARHPSDPYEYERGTVDAHGSVEWYPKHERFWTSWRTAISKQIDDDPYKVETDEEFDDDDSDDFEETDTRYDLVGLIGGHIGTKWKGEVEATYDGRHEDIDRIRGVLTRDLHDAVFGVSVTARKETNETVEDERVKTRRQWDRYKIKVAVSAKLPDRDIALGGQQITTAQDRRKAEIE